MAPSSDLLTRAEAAAYLRCSQSKLSHGWGPPPLRGFTRPVMYSRAAIERWLAACQPEVNECSTAVKVPRSGGSSSTTAGRRSVGQRIRQIEQMRKERLAKSGQASKKTKALSLVPTE